MMLKFRELVELGLERFFSKPINTFCRNFRGMVARPCTFSKGRMSIRNSSLFLHLQRVNNFTDVMPTLEEAPVEALSLAEHGKSLKSTLSRIPEDIGVRDNFVKTIR